MPSVRPLPLIASTASFMSAPALKAVPEPVRIAAYTSGSAYLNHLDDTGVLRAGFRADLVVLDRDPFAGPATEISETRVAATYVAGKRVYVAG